MTVRRAKWTDEDGALGLKMEKIWRIDYLDHVVGLYYTHHNEEGESKKPIDFDLFKSQEDKDNNIIFSQVLVEAVRVIEKPRSSLSINKLNFKSQAVDENIHKSYIVWMVQVFEDGSMFYFESVQRLLEYRNDFRYWQEKGIFEEPLPTSKQKGVLENFFQIPLKRLPYKIMGGKDADYQSLHQYKRDR